MTDNKSVTVRNAVWPEDAGTLQSLRGAVFISEQGVPESVEWDGQDAGARHVIAEADGAPVGCGRLLADGRIGRLAVLAPHRGLRIGAALLDALVVIARQRGEPALYLHAQADAVQFYERSGFMAEGEPFDEAGLPHVDMRLRLDYRDWNQDIVNLQSPHPFAELVVAQARLARRELRILSPRLDTRVFDNEDLTSAIRQLLRNGRVTRVQIVVQDARAVVQRGHRLLALSRRLPSKVELRRLAEHPDWNGDTIIIRDRDSLLELPASEANPGFYRPGDRARSALAITRFEELWRVAQVDPEFRSLSI